MIVSFPTITITRVNCICLSKCTSTPAASLPNLQMVEIQTTRVRLHFDFTNFVLFVFGKFLTATYGDWESCNRWFRHEGLWKRALGEFDGCHSVCPKPYRTDHWCNRCIVIILFGSEKCITVYFGVGWGGVGVGIRGTVVGRWTTGQQVEQSILRQGHDS